MFPKFPNELCEGILSYLEEDLKTWIFQGTSGKDFNTGPRVYSMYENSSLPKNSEVAFNSCTSFGYSGYPSRAMPKSHFRQLFVSGYTPLLSNPPNLTHVEGIIEPCYDPELRGTDIPYEVLGCLLMHLRLNYVRLHGSS
ncbi:hypothetical protein M422DRAFT_47226 [Sphaerobolus stellatus SS14]|uniref:Uncharacterized protein n=1 Tax=Sphaerobolus stellatus (strain SS14) TaxID=990650 RepID=A0A0C9VCE6_SPHS4|nr:hypothetical protein M422DRAFT_47225 [Sphaerobolus stellatus SS14]KIJ44649.1 hypothetical protein M422DRAFT_47226 [Sphaerobolus stellatus SS14]